MITNAPRAITAALVAAVCAFGFTACGSSNDNNSSSGASGSTQSSGSGSDNSVNEGNVHDQAQGLESLVRDNSR